MLKIIENDFSLKLGNGIALKTIIMHNYNRQLKYGSINFTIASSSKSAANASKGKPKDWARSWAIVLLLLELLKDRKFSCDD